MKVLTHHQNLIDEIITICLSLLGLFYVGLLSTGIISLIWSAALITITVLCFVEKD